MLRTLQRFLTRAFAVALVCTLLSGDAFAIIKEVDVWGAYSVNNLGQSDNHSSMSELKEDYSDFVKTDGLREYFYKADEDLYKFDLSEALSWLIDNEIISRDQTVTVSNLGRNNVPVVNIDKIDVNDLAAKYVKRSDLIMYLYKAVFGPIDARTIGVESANIRTDGGAKDTLTNIMQRHNYMTGLNSEITDGIYQFLGDGKPGSAGNASGFRAVGGDGGEIGETKQEITEYMNDSENWRYTPQGDEYDSMFGDTNIFISQNEFNQTVTTGDGGDGGDATATSGDGTASAAGGGGGSSGNGQNAIQYQTDYKQIYYVPGADLMFYRTNDCLELYIRAALGKGLLQVDTDVRTAKFEETFLKGSSSTTALESYSPAAPAFIYNRAYTEQITSTNVKQATTDKVLGVNFNINYSGNTLSVQRLNLFSSNSGFFSSETVYKMDVYKYIYEFLNVSEKKISDLESDIVNYKYGMELEGTAKEDDIKVLKYLIAKGILNYDSGNDFASLYTPVMYGDILPILYRVANTNARLDFSKIQLTDSETQWKANGFSPLTMYIIEGDSPSPLRVEYSAEYTQQQDRELEERNVAQGDYAELASAVNTMSVKYAEDGSIADSTDLDELLNSVQTSEFFDENIRKLQLEDSAASLIICNNSPDSGSFAYNFTLHPQGLRFSPSNIATELDKYFNGDYSLGGDDTLGSPIKGFLSRCEKLDGLSDVPRANSALVALQTDCINNLFVLAMMKANMGVADSVYQYLDKWIDEFENNGSKYTIVTINQIRFSPFVAANAMRQLKSKLENNLSMLNSVNFVYTNSANNELTTPDFIGTFGGGEGALTGFANVFQSCEVVVNNNQTAQSSFTLTRSSSTGYTLAGSTWIEKVESAGNVNIDFSTPVSPESLTTLQNGGDGSINDVTSQGVISAKANGYSIPIMERDGAQYVSWASIELYNDKVSSDRKLPLEKISDTLLRNTDTDTTAFFSGQNEVGSCVQALVGTAVVVGDGTQGVAFKDTSSGVANYYYRADIISMLVNAKQESMILGGSHLMALGGDGFLNNLTVHDLQSESGFTGSELNGICALVSTAPEKVTDKNAAWDSGQTVSGDPSGHWINYLSLTQANRAANILSRTIPYTTSTNSAGVAFAVVKFRPVDLEVTGTKKLDNSTTLQSLLDSPASGPSTEEGQLVFNSNKDKCNVYANWIYGTASQTYVETGYLVPQATLYVDSIAALNEIPASIWGALTDEQIAGINIVTLTNIDAGAACKIGAVPPAVGIARSSANYQASYSISADYTCLITGRRIYLAESEFTKLTREVDENNEVYYRANNAYGQRMAFTVGSTFKISANEKLGTGDATISMPQALVTKTSSDGTVTAEVGPVFGLPIRLGSSSVMVYKPERFGDAVVGSASGVPKTTASSAEFNMIQSLKDEMAPLGVTIRGVSQEPTTPLVAISRADLTELSSPIVFTNTQLKVYPSKDVKNAITKSAKDYSGGTTTLSKVISDTQKIFQGMEQAGYVTQAVAYVEIEFSAYEYTLKNGLLVHGKSEAADYLSPSLFTSLNDLIIDEMIGKAQGAIPINQIPAGALLEVGTGYYVSKGTEDTREFVGYSKLGDATSGAILPQVQDAAKSFAGHFVRGGNQYINICHYFRSFKVLEAADKYKEDLVAVADATMVQDKMKKVAVFGKSSSANTVSNTKIISPGEGSRASEAYMYAPVVIEFEPILYAYVSGSYGTGSSKVDKYTICSVAENSMAGAFENTPFFSDNVLAARLLDYSSEMVSGSYQQYEGRYGLMAAIREEFAEAFAGDLFTLARMLMFILLIWLFVSSWICFGFYQGNLMPIIDSIKHPTNRPNGKGGLDLFRVISLGTISVDSDFKLGRFLEYDLILALLILVVWKSGNITF